MGKPKLFMLNPWLEDDDSGPYYCPDCGVVEDFLTYSPDIRDKIEIINVDFARPRNAIVALLGLEHQDSPVLVLDEDAAGGEGVVQSMSTGRKFINDPLVICTFLVDLYGGVKPHP